MSSKSGCAFLPPYDQWIFLRLKGTEHEKHGSSTASLDLEIIAQGEADEKRDDDRKEGLPDHKPLIAFRWDRMAILFVEAKEKFLDVRVYRERADERHSIGARNQLNRLFIFVSIEQARM